MHTSPRQDTNRLFRRMVKKSSTQQPCSGRWLGAFLCLFTAASAACIEEQVRERSTGEIAPTLAMSTYIEEGTQAAIVVGVRPALSRRDRPYLPLEIAVANKGLAALTLNPESFTLVDAQGRRYPMAAPAELSREYGSTDADRRLGEVQDILRRKYLQYERVPSNFTPSFRAPVATKQVALSRFSYLVDMIYFPNPTIPTPEGPFDLLVRAEETPDPFVIRFYVGRPR
jgi:hypothetical protein